MVAEGAEEVVAHDEAELLLHLAELLDFSPIEALYATAPQIFGDTEREAEVKQIMRMPKMASMTMRAASLPPLADLARGSSSSSS